MNRRSLFALPATLALFGAAATRAQAASRSMTVASLDLSWEGKIEWSTEARNSEWALAAYQDLALILTKGFAPMSGDGVGFDWLLQLKDPRFIVNMKPIWNTYSGWDPSELAPAVLLIEGGVEIGEFRFFRYHNPDRPGYVPDWAKKGYGLRKAHLEDHLQKKLEKKLPGQVEMDLRWMGAEPFTKQRTVA